MLVHLVAEHFGIWNFPFWNFSHWDCKSKAQCRKEKPPGLTEAVFFNQLVLFVKKMMNFL